MMYFAFTSAAFSLYKVNKKAGNGMFIPRSSSDERFSQSRYNQVPSENDSLYKLQYQNSMFSFKMTDSSKKKKNHFIDCNEFLKSNGTEIARGAINFK